MYSHKLCFFISLYSYQVISFISGHPTLQCSGYTCTPCRGASAAFSWACPTHYTAASQGCRMQTQPLDQPVFLHYNLSWSLQFLGVIYNNWPALR